MTADDMQPEGAYPPFEQVDHTADLALLVRGRNLGELFVNAALGLASLLIDRSTVHRSMERRIELSAADAEELLVAWLQEILYLLEGRREIHGDFRIEKITQQELSAVCVGEPLDPCRHQLQAEIKAATYHDLRIRETDSPWGRILEVRIVLDT